MSVIVERAIVAVVKIEAPSMEAADAAFADARRYIERVLPKQSLGAGRIIERFIGFTSAWTRS